MGEAKLTAASTVTPIHRYLTRAHILIATRTAVLMRYKTKGCYTWRRARPQSQRVAKFPTAHNRLQFPPVSISMIKRPRNSRMNGGFWGEIKGIPGWRMAEKRWPNVFRQPAWKLWEFSSALQNIDLCLCYSSHRCFKLKPPSPAAISLCPHSGTGLAVSCVGL